MQREEDEEKTDDRTHVEFTWCGREMRELQQIE